MNGLAERLRASLVPAVPVPFRGSDIDAAALRRYVAWMADQPVAGVAVWAHTGRGPHLSAEQRRLVLETWREALPDRLIIAGARDISMAIEARRGKADALLVFPTRDDPVGLHRRLGQELPAIAFHLYQAAGGAEYNEATVDALLELPRVIGIKVATLDSVMTFQRIAAQVKHRHPEKLLITGEDRFLGYSLMMGAQSALIGMGAALTAMQAELITTHAARDWPAFHRLSAACDALAQATFVEPMEGYIRRMLWVLAAQGIIPRESCDDPWGPELPESERAKVEDAATRLRPA